jgi:hypothetical protein
MKIEKIWFSGDKIFILIPNMTNTGIARLRITAPMFSHFKARYAALDGNAIITEFKGALTENFAIQLRTLPTPACTAAGYFLRE